MLVQNFDVRKAFGTSVRTWRGRLGISQEELAGRAGLHRTYVSDVERGARNVTLQSIEKLAHALEISGSTLLAYTRQPPAAGGRVEEFVPEELVDILFVEDDQVAVKLTRESLKSITNRIHVASDGQAALHFLFGTGEYAQRKTENLPQLILLDLGLPKVDGLEVLRRIKADPRTSSIPVIVLAGSVLDRDLKMSKQLGAAACIMKPVRLQNLIRVTPQLNLHWALLKPALPAQIQQTPKARHDETTPGLRPARI
jgi:CheY-like chemotaxis protein/DNA-binding XRE family transcriptional regulator